MGLMDFLMDTWTKTKNVGPLEHRLFETVAKQDSKNAASIGNKLGWQWLENQGNENAKDPRRALAHGAIGAATYFAGPYLWAQGPVGQTAAGAGASEGLAESGLFAGQQGAMALTEEQIQQQAVQQMLQQQAQQQAAQQALQEGAQQGIQQGGSALAKGGLFEQVPGVANGSPQWQALAQQNADLGGQAWDATAKAAMNPVKDAYRTGAMGKLDYLGNVLKADSAGMNDPSVWASRLGSNLDRMAGKAGQNMATNQLQSAFSSKATAPPSPMPQQQAQGPQQIVSPQEREKLMDDYRAGRISEDELRRRLGVNA